MGIVGPLSYYFSIIVAYSYKERVIMKRICLIFGEDADTIKVSPCKGVMRGGIYPRPYGFLLSCNKTESAR